MDEAKLYILFSLVPRASVSPWTKERYVGVGVIVVIFFPANG